MNLYNFINNTRKQDNLQNSIQKTSNKELNELIKLAEQERVFDDINKEDFINLLKLELNATGFIKKLNKNKKIKLISHLDADGITSAAIIINALEKLNQPFELTIVPQLTEDICKELAKENFDDFIITDLGSGQLSFINKHFTNKQVLILDHHEIQEPSLSNIVHVNPHLFNIDGSKFISGSGVSFLFTYFLDNSNKDVSHLALIGAIGDTQESNGFIGINKLFFKIAIDNNLINVSKALNFFGKQTRSLIKLLEYSSDLYIPGISGNESNTVLFLTNLGIKLVNSDGTQKKYTDLTEQEKKLLTEHIIIKRIQNGLTDQTNVLTNMYIINNESMPEFKDLKEFSTLLNACGRMNKAEIGVFACLNKDSYKKLALNVHKDYKKEIINGMRWINNNLTSNNIIKTDKYMIINAKNNILYTIIGTTASILTKNGKFPNNYLILSLAENPDLKLIKSSLRIVGNNPDVDLQKIITSIIKSLGVGEAGGHKHAAGAIIPLDQEEKFISISKSILDSINIK